MNIFLAVMVAALAQGEPVMKTNVVFQSGEGGYHTYRIPAIVRAADGTLLAFCEGRVHGQGDANDIDIVLKRSHDGGSTWGSMQVIVDDGDKTCGNPAPVVLKPTGDVLLVYTSNRGEDDEGAILRGEAPPRTVWTIRSTDHGLTWTKPREISGQVRQADWRWYATGPGHAIQLTSSRIVVPCNHSKSADQATWASHVIFSDDLGGTWSIGGIAEGYTNESTVAELADGRLYLNMRNYRGTHRRAMAYSLDQGVTWGPVEGVPDLVEPVCQASCLVPEGSGVLLFSNPASTRRERLTVKRSADGGRHWPDHLLLHEGPAAYSDLVDLGDGEVGCLYECGSKSPYEQISFSRFSLDAFAPR